MYEILFSEVVAKQQARIPKKDLEKIKMILTSLKENPRPFKCKKLAGGEQEYRIRYRDWRILYSINDRDKKIILFFIFFSKKTLLF